MPVTRRSLVLGSSVLGATAFAATVAPRVSFTQAIAQAVPGPFKLDPLPYPVNAFEPHIDAKTMELHHDRHHLAYVTNLNNAAKEHSALASMSLPDLLRNLQDVPESVRALVRNNGGGHANHTMFWQVMGAGGGKPDGELAAAVVRDFNGLETLQNKFNDAGLRVFGSGWVFVTVTRSGKLALETRPNQDTPLMEGGRVLFGNDVWEHAYYLSYQNRRADYLKAWWNTLDWRKVGERYAAATVGTLAV